MKKTSNKQLPKESDIFFSDNDSQKQKKCVRSKKNYLSLIDHNDNDKSQDESQFGVLHFPQNQQKKEYMDPFAQQSQGGIKDPFSESLDFDQNDSDKQSEESHSIVELESLESQDKNVKAKRIKKVKKKCPNDSTRVRKNKQKSKKPDKEKGNTKRKIRTPVSQEKVKILQHLFPFILGKIPYKGTQINLKDVSRIVDLGYSTVLHKFRDFRRKGEIQKGLLLRFKDVKRKYGKSLVIEKYIKESLQENEFKTASQLATYINDKYNIRANRSIISRHLNQMQRQKYEFLGDKQLGKLKREENQQVRQNAQNLREFSKIFFGLKNQNLTFLYLTVIRLYLVDDKLVQQIDDQEDSFTIINLVVTATQAQLMKYYITTPNQTELFLSTKTSHLNSSAYEALYNQLQVNSEQKQWEALTNPETVIVVFPYKDLKKEFQYRQRIMNKLLDESINILVMPPRFQAQEINFIHKWFQKSILPIAQENKFETLDNLKQAIFSLMKQLQSELGKYATEMMIAVKRIQ